MTDEFERFLNESLAPAERLPDRRFVAAVQARIALDERLRAERRALAAGFGKQLIGLGAVAAAVWVLALAAPVASSISEYPAPSLAFSLTGFALLVALLVRAGGGAKIAPDF